jgi:heme A synthase
MQHTEHAAPFDARPIAPADPAGRQAATLRRIAQMVLLLVATVIVSSAWLRHSADPRRCTPAPACAAAGDGVQAARLLHRASAGLVLVAVAVLVLGTAQPRRRGAGTARALLGVTLALAALGLVAAGSRAPAVVLGNLGGGFTLLALAARWPPAPGQRGAPLGWPAWATLALLAAVAATGAWPRPTAALATLHQALALAAVLAVAALAARAWRTRRPASVALLLLAALVSALGFGSLGAPDAVSFAAVLAHNLGAALLLAVVSRLA